MGREREHKQVHNDNNKIKKISHDKILSSKCSDNWEVGVYYYLATFQEDFGGSLLTHFEIWQLFSMAVSISGFKMKYPMCVESNLFVPLAAFWVNFFILGVLRSNAVIYSGLVNVFGVNRQYAAWPYGTFGFFMSVTGAVTGFLTNYWSIRSLAIFGATLASLSVSICSLAYQMELIIFFYGALQGIGIGIVVPLTHVVLNQNFSKYRALAMGIAYSGSSAGLFIFPPISNYILSVYDLDGTFLLLGGFMLHSVLGAMFYKTPNRHTITQKLENKNAKESSVIPVFQSKRESDCADIPPDAVTKNEKVRDSDVETSKETAAEDKNIPGDSPVGASGTVGYFCSAEVLALAFEVLSSPKFLIISFAYATYFSSSAIFLMVVLDYAKDRGLEEVKSVFLVSAFSFGDLAGRLACGWIADLQIIRRGCLVRLYLIATGTLFLLLPAMPDAALSYISVALGVISGGIIVNYSVLLNEYLGIQKLPMTMGFSTFIVGMSSFIRPVVIGYFRDYHESYDLLFVFLGLLEISIASVWFLEVLIPVARQQFCVNKNVK